MFFLQVTYWVFEFIVLDQQSILLILDWNGQIYNAWESKSKISSVSYFLLSARHSYEISDSTLNRCKAYLSFVLDFLS